ncbi:uroporphyrinogen-III synthase [Ruixingdingia sedimenti]|uniref:Uroporphyrinogen-III synthase n=1 Tax=Ruixingdingia sedimenti TaxID=3073604 RepID=A0ABU1F6H5_9RHOB|nr:uroporphyrinogen-III synthase [Xinfangfangia sp. LG-4]MDR5652480.1 uroporphyrinogen-III synthase [Xinfangfangia sp. LG-4]
MTAQSRPVILLTRPEPAAARFAAALRDHLPGAEVLMAPLIAPRLLSPPLPPVWGDGRVRGLIFTSETGVAGFARIAADRSLPAFCVGPHTADVARAAGFTAHACGGDAEAVVAELTALRPAAPLLHARGRDARGAIAARLSAAGIETGELIVYEQQEQPLSAPALALLAGDAPVIAPLFSPRTAAIFARAAAGVRAPLYLAAISPAAAAELSGLPARMRLTAEAPDAPAMLRAAAALHHAAQAAA